MFEKLGGRKMVALVLTMVAGVGVALAKGDVPPHLAEMIILSFGLFSGANIAATLGGISLEKAKHKAAPTGVPVDHAVAAFQDLAQKVEANHTAQQASTTELTKSLQLTQNALSMIAEKILSR